MLHIADFNNFYSTTGGGVRTYHTHKMEYMQGRDDVQYTLFLSSDRNAIEDHGNNTRLVHLPAVPVPGADHYRYVLASTDLGHHVAKLRPDIIEVGSPYIAPWIARAAAKRCGALLVGFWHADYPRAYAGRYAGQLHPALGPLAHDVAWWYAKQTYGRYTATFAAADCVVQELWARGIPRVFQTPLGVDTERFHPQHRDPELRSSVGASDGRPLLFFPHRLIEEKGLSQLLDAFPRIWNAHRPVLVFAGIGPGQAKLDAFMANHEDVHHLGFITDPKLMARWYASADAVFALSAFETFGLSAAEAMASGNALIAANAGAAAEWATKSDCGVLVPYGDADALAAETIAFLSSQRLEQCGLNARSFAARHFNWTRAFDRMMDFYQTIHDAGSAERLSPEPRRWLPT
ncbi:MAG: glycosyltransferase [Myxococcota bacterium]